MFIETLYNLIHGIFAGLSSFIFFYVLGFFCLSEKFFISLKFKAFPVFLGVAIFTFIGWYGIQYHFSFNIIFPTVFLLLLLLIGLRIKNIRQWKLWQSGQNNKQNIFFWITAYIILYCLVYLFLPTPLSHEYLPIGRVGNLDIFHYINGANHLHTFGSFNVAHASPHEPFNLYYDTPAVFYLHGWLSLFYHHNTMTACMPLIYNFSASIGLIITYYCYRFFSCPRQISLCIAAILLCGIFYRYIIGFYFLSSIIGTLIWLTFLIEILSLDFALPIKKHRFAYLFIMMRTYEWLLLLIYPILFLANMIISTGVIGLMLFLTNRPFHSGNYLKKLLFFLACLFLSTGLLFILNVDYYVTHVIENLVEFSERTKVVWGMPILSPLAILGIPSPLTLASSQYIIIPVFIAFIAALFFCFQKIRKWQPAELVLFILLVSSLIIYWLYFYQLGETRYQPWKFASYFVLPLSGVFWAVFANILAVSSSYRKIFVSITLFCIFGNFFCYLYPIKTLSKKYEQLAQLNDPDLIKSHDLVLKMSNKASTFMPVFFIPDKRLHFLSESYYPQEDEKTIPGSIPFFLESSKGCPFQKADKDHYEISGLGCLYFQFSTYKNEIKK